MNRAVNTGKFRQFHQYYPIRWLSLSKPGWGHLGFNFSQASTGSAHGVSGKGWYIQQKTNMPE